MTFTRRIYRHTNMASAVNIFKREQVHHLSSTIETSTGKIIAYTKLSSDGESLTIGATDGVTVWKIDITDEEIDTYKSVAEISSKDAYLARIRSTFTVGDLQASQVPSQMLLTFGTGSNAFTLDLYETTAQERKTEIQEYIFRQHNRIITLEKELKDANETVTSLQRAKSPEATVPDLREDRVAKKPKLARQRQRKGESVINPGNRRLKTASGVDFDE